MRLRVLALSFVIAVAGGCGDAANEDGPLVVEEGCQPLLAQTVKDESQATCLLPFPSDFHRVADPASETGFRVAFRGAAVPRRATGQPVDPHEHYAGDGASILPPIVGTLPAAVAKEGLPGANADPANSARPESATLLFDVERAAFVAHYTDLHPNADDPKHTAIVLRPIAPLRARARYVAAFAGVKDDSGVAAPAEGFRRLRDGRGDPAIEGLRERFEREVFGPLVRAGVARERLQLAWDFTTGSAEQPRRDMLHMKDLALAWLATNTPAVQVTNVEEDAKFRRVTATITGPSFLTDETTRARILRGPDGRPAQNGTTTFPVLVRIPAAVRDGASPGRLLAYGHGFFGSRGELDSGAAKKISERLAAVIFGIDWRGMSQPDRSVVSDTLIDDPPRVAEFTERVHQAMVNWLVTVAVMRGPATGIAELRRVDGGAAWDPAFAGYFGASLGHILGGTLAGLETSFARVVLNVGGAGFTHIMPRSSNFGPFAILLRGVFQDSLMVQTYIATLQRSLDRIDPVTWAPDVGPKALLQIGLGDPGVPNLTSFVHARALGARQIVPAPRRIFGLEETPGGQAGSTITLFDYGIDTSSDEPQPLAPNIVHDAVRVEDAAVRQMDAFLRPDGVAVHPCDGPCDPG